MNKCENCKNYEEKKLPKVTKQEVGLKFWEFADECVEDACTATKKHFGIEGVNIKCTGYENEYFHKVCGDCISLFTDAINKDRGY